MNYARRRELMKINNALEEFKVWVDDVICEEQDSFNNLTENLQQTDRGKAMEEAIDNLNDAMDAIEEAIDTLVAMGLTRFDATQVVKNIATPEMSAEELIKLSLKNMNK